ncbi:MAG TPA: hypothetical protein VG028_21615 [Terriglobia bacterium]|nr:hypothetical protein [Terriglobia bacterium]
MRPLEPEHIRQRGPEGLHSGTRLDQLRPGHGQFGIGSRGVGARMEGVADSSGREGKQNGPCVVQTRGPVYMR